MSTSGSIDWTVTRDEILTMAFELVGALEEGESIRTTQIVKGSRYLNAVVKSLQGEGTPLWKIEWQQYQPTASTVVLASDGNSYTCIRSHTSSSGDEPGTGTNWTTFWKLTGTSTTNWVTSTSYNAIGDFSLTNDVIGILEAFWRDNTVDRPVWIVSREEYFDQTDKTTPGIPNKLWFSRQSLTAPTIYVWPQPDVDPSSDITEVLHYSAITRNEDFDTGANTPDFDVIWNRALAFLTAYDLSFTEGLPIQERQLLKLEAQEAKGNALGGSEEQMDMKIMPRTEN